MCPIHETDNAEERWSQAEWEHYELWEKIEARGRRVRRLWIGAAVLVFLLLSAVPVVRDRGIQWKALRATRELGQQINSLKSEAGRREQAFRIRPLAAPPLTVSVEWGPSCDSSQFTPAPDFMLLERDPARDRLGWVAASRGRELGIPGLLDEFCYEPVHGGRETAKPQALAGFMVAPVSELTPERQASVLIRGPSAEISFE